MRPSEGWVVDRRRFIGTVAGGLLAAPLAAGAQQAGKVYRIGYLSDRLGPGAFEEAFLRGLRELGYVQGRNIMIEYRWAEGKVERLSALAAELISLQVDMIVTAGVPAAKAAKAATSTTPVVMATSADAVGDGLIASFARPGGNVTGISLFSRELSGKQSLESATVQGDGGCGGEAWPQGAASRYPFP
jgi:putative tryptophan/tyrosine transport system substrate-binding protein